MRPQRQPLIRDVAVERVEVPVQRIEVQRVGRLERHAFERDDHHQGTGVKRDHPFIDVADVGDEGLGFELTAPDGRGTRQGRDPFRHSAERASSE